MKQLEVGQTLFIRPLGNAARRNPGIMEWSIQRIGRKFFYANNEKFTIDTLKQENGIYMSQYKAYLSMQEIVDENIYNKLRDAISDKTRYGFEATLDQLKQIADILNIEYTHETI